MIATLLLLYAAALVLTTHLLVRTTRLRRSPRAALFLWQSFALTAVVCLLLAGPVALAKVRPWPESTLQGAIALGTGIACLGVLVHLLHRGHRIGRRIRAARAEHRRLVDLVGRHEDLRTRVLPSALPAAYCVPGGGSRLVLSEALTTLPPEQVEAVLAHERAHLRERHDLILEFFTVLHTATPPPLRPEAALREVALLVEVLADRAARATAGEVALGRALVTLAETTSAAPGIVPGTSAGAGAALTRLRLLATDDAGRGQTGALYLLAAATPLLPVALALLLL